MRVAAVSRFFLLFAVSCSRGRAVLDLDTEDVSRHGNVVVTRGEVVREPVRTDADLTTAKRGKTLKFYVDYESGVFRKDGKPFRYVSGSLHYARVPHEYWQDRLRRFAAVGLDAVQTLVPWNFHEPWPGVYDFTGSRDLLRFIHTAQSEGLLVLLRVGPYICAEWDSGGLPAWLLMENPGMQVRTNAADYMGHVERYWGILLPKLVPYLYENGGPIVMVQIENEYGSFPRGRPEHVAALLRLAELHLGSDVVYYTTDGNSKGYFSGGRTDGALTTVDFGPTDDPAAAFRDLAEFDSGFRGPFVNSELYTGWFAHWGDPFQRFSPEDLARRLDLFLKSNGSAFSVNMYMFHGGTTFGFFPGANSNGDGSGYGSDPNSYDYDSPLTENAGCGLKCTAVRRVLLGHASKSRRRAVPDMPANVSSAAYGMIQMNFVDSLTNLKRDLAVGEPKMSPWPLTFEELRQDSGFVLYEASPALDYTGVTLRVEGLADEAVVLVDGVRRGSLSRQNRVSNLTDFDVRRGQTLSILVHNMGRVNYGGYTSDLKGLRQVILGEDLLPHWTMYSIPLNETGSALDSKLPLRRVAREGGFEVPAFFRASFELPAAAGPVGTGYLPDTFLKLTSFRRGVAFVNGVNVGRFWNGVGPVDALYVPGPYLNAAGTPNTVLVLELDGADCSAAAPDRCYVEFVSEQVLLEASVVVRDTPSGRRPRPRA